MRSGNMVSNAIDPRPRRTTRIEPFETPPQLEMNFLDQIAALVRIDLISPRQPFQRRTELLRHIAVQFVLARHAVHIEGSRRLRNFLTDYLRAAWINSSRGTCRNFPWIQRPVRREYGNRRRTFWQPR